MSQQSIGYNKAMNATVSTTKTTLAAALGVRAFITCTKTTTIKG
jgi:hypothetical protein